MAEYEEFAIGNSIDEAYYGYLNQEYPNLATKYLKELPQLIERLIDAGIKDSNHLSRYIKENRLGDEYPDEIGVITMGDGDREWEFDGGVSPTFYSVLCEELGLQRAGSGARVKNFKPYASNGKG